MKWFLRRTGVLLALGVPAAIAARGDACVVQRPPTELEREIEIEDFGPDLSSGRHNYRISVDVNVFGNISDTVNCQCAALLGSAPALGSLPSSVRITELELSIYSLADNEYEYEFEAPEFENEGFEIDDDLEQEIEGMEGAIDAETGSAFRLDIDPFVVRPLGPGERHRLAFNLTVAEEDISKIVNVPIQFAAGSNSPSHPLTFFTGYQDTLTLPSAVSFSPADFDQDGDVDDADRTAWEQSFTLDGGGDVNDDGVTDGADFLALQQQFGAVVASSAVASSVPEPCSFVLAGTLALASTRRRRPR